MEARAAESLLSSAGGDTQQAPAALEIASPETGLEDSSEEPERTGEDWLKELIHQRRVTVQT